jgi:hypothetical protein
VLLPFAVAIPEKTGRQLLRSMAKEHFLLNLIWRYQDVESERRKKLPKVVFSKFFTNSIKFL